MKLLMKFIILFGIQYCDWYIEFSKSIFQRKNENLKETKKVSIWAFIEILKLISSYNAFHN